jgi:hypothetical protein
MIPDALEDNWRDDTSSRPDSEFAVSSGDNDELTAFDIEEVIASIFNHEENGRRGKVWRPSRQQSD